MIKLSEKNKIITDINRARQVTPEWRNPMSEPQSELDKNDSELKKALMQINCGNDKSTGNESYRVLQQYSYLRIKDSTLIPPPLEVIKINGEIISIEGNVKTVSGASKSGKSAFVCVLIVGAIKTGVYDGFPGVEIKKNHGKAVIHIDIEQARLRHQKNLCSILKRAGLEHCPDNLLSYNIREEDLEKCITITEKITKAAYEKFNGVHLIVMDGGADYIQDVNKPDLSNMIVKFFERLAIKQAVMSSGYQTKRKLFFFGNEKSFYKYK
jgi:hypothetical protein